MGITTAIWCGLLMGFWPTFGSDPLETTFPLEAKGNIRFQADLARFLEDGKPVVEVVLSIPETALVGAADSARLHVTLEPLDSDEHILARFETELRLPPLPEHAPERAFPVPTRWIRLRPRWVEGTWALRVRVENPERAKRGLLDRLRGEHPSGELAARLVPEEGPAGPPRGLSDPLFVWAAQSAGAEADEPGLREIRSRLQPNPYRYYGRYQPVLTAYWERYPGVLAPEDSVLIERRRILSLPDGLELSAGEETLRAPQRPEWTLRRFDLTELAGGGYRLEVSWRRPREVDHLLARLQGDFQVVWEEQSWQLDEARLLAIGRVLLPSREFEKYSALDRGGKENYLRLLWERNSPSGGQGENPLELKFRDRVRFVEDRFGGLRGGLLSDRGRVYVRYGPPDEVRFELNPQDTEILSFQLPAEMAADGEDNPSARDRLSKRRSPEDNRPYEIWEYTRRGDPLLPQYVNPGNKIGLKFIFVDELGDGDFVLVYTNVPGSLQ